MCTRYTGVTINRHDYDMAKDTGTYEGKISDLKFDDKNFNKHTDRGMEMLKSSVGDNGFGRSILVDKDNRIIAGNGIVETAGKLGKERIRVVETDGKELVVVKRTDLSLDSRQGREMALADNAAAAVDLDWDEEAMLEMRERFNMDFEKYGLDIQPMDFGAPDGNASDVDEDDFDEGTDATPKKARRGDVWLVGEHRIVCGDSTRPETLKSLMRGESVDLLLTDPPYNVDYTGGATGDRKAIANDALPDAAFREFLTAALTNAQTYMRPGASFYVWYAIAQHTAFVESVLASDLKISEYLIWVKNTFTLGRMDYHYRHEPCIYGWKLGAAHSWYSDRAQSTVLEFPKPVKSEDHPTMKPLPMFAYQMGNSSKEGDIVLDIFGGSGTTLIAAEQLGRRARIVEYEEHYVDVILARYIKLVGDDGDVWRLNPDGTQTAYADVVVDD